MFDIYAQSTPSPTYIPAGPDSRSRLIRACRWIFWAGAAASWIPVMLHGLSMKRNRFALLEWACFFICNTGNFVLGNMERSRRETSESEQL